MRAASGCGSWGSWRCVRPRVPSPVNDANDTKVIWNGGGSPGPRGTGRGSWRGVERLWICGCCSSSRVEQTKSYFARADRGEKRVHAEARRRGEFGQSRPQASSRRSGPRLDHHRKGCSATDGPQSLSAPPRLRVNQINLWVPRCPFDKLRAARGASGSTTWTRRRWRRPGGGPALRQAQDDRAAGSSRRLRRIRPSRGLRGRGYAGLAGGARPVDHEPPPSRGPAPPAPPGVDPVRWAYADERERKRMVRQVRG